MNNHAHIIGTKKSCLSTKTVNELAIMPVIFGEKFLFCLMFFSCLTLGILPGVFWFIPSPEVKTLHYILLYFIDINGNTTILLIDKIRKPYLSITAKNQELIFVQ